LWKTVTKRRHSGKSVSVDGRTHKHAGTGERRSELAFIAYTLVAKHGLEGLRTRMVAEAAGIDTGTLHYHFPSKNALIEAVLHHLATDFGKNRSEGPNPPKNALDELHNEIRDVALRVKECPEQFRVLIDLRLHASRHPVIARILGESDHIFHRFLKDLLSRGIRQGKFRRDVNVELEASVLGTDLMGLGFISLLPHKRVDDIAEAVYKRAKIALTQKCPRGNASGASDRPRQRA
jgi:AcrR family transcriptional regulator